jgi:hypothetical protein
MVSCSISSADKDIVGGATVAALVRWEVGKAKEQSVLRYRRCTPIRCVETSIGMKKWVVLRAIKRAMLFGDRIHEQRNSTKLMFCSHIMFKK